MLKPGRSPKESPWLTAIICFFCLGCLLLYSVPAWERAFQGKNDFLAFYAGARLVGTADLYDKQANIGIHGEVISGHSLGTYYVRVPFHALILSPLGKLAYLTAYAIFTGLSVAALAVFLARWRREFPDLVLFCCMSIPLLTTFLMGQDAVFVLLLVGASLLLARKGRDWEAGLVFSLCSIKFHLFVLVPVVLLIYRRWKFFWAAAAGVAVVTAISFLVQGADWPQHYLNQLDNPLVHGGPQYMPTLRGLLAPWGLEGTFSLIAVSATVGSLFTYVAWKAKDFEQAFAYSLIAGLLVGFHAYIYDCVLLLIPLAILSQRASPAVRLLLVLAVSPLPYVILLIDSPANYFLIALLMAVLVFAAFSEQKSARVAQPA